MAPPDSDGNAGGAARGAANGMAAVHGHAAASCGAAANGSSAAAAAAAAPAGSASDYELVAILIHKGASASHGHYGEARNVVCKGVESTPSCLRNQLCVSSESNKLCVSSGPPASGSPCSHTCQYRACGGTSKCKCYHSASAQAPQHCVLSAASHPHAIAVRSCRGCSKACA